MKVQELKGELNTGMLEPCSGIKTEKIENGTRSTRAECSWITIKKGRYELNGISHPLRAGNEKFYKRMYGLHYKNRKVYWLETFVSHSSSSGYHVSFNWREHQIFLWSQGEHWLQKEENIRYIVNVIFLVLGVIIGFKQI
jgi:hypothetical protein